MEKYNRQKAKEYAKIWAYKRNPRYYNYDSLGGDCTNFISQCIYAGSGVMNYTKTYGWYYNNANDKSPSWTGVDFLYNFFVRSFPKNLLSPPIFFDILISLSFNITFILE